MRLHKKVKIKMWCPSVNSSRSTTRTPTHLSLMEGRCRSTWTAWPLETLLTSEGPMDSWCIRAMVWWWCFLWKEPKKEVSTLTCWHQQEALCDLLWLRLCVIHSGQFAIRPDKKSEPKVRKFKHVGMIAGGTGPFSDHSNNFNYTRTSFRGTSQRTKICRSVIYLKVILRPACNHTFQVLYCIMLLF